MHIRRSSKKVVDICILGSIYHFKSTILMHPTVQSFLSVHANFEDDIGKNYDFISICHTSGKLSWRTLYDIPYVTLYTLSKSRFIVMLSSIRRVRVQYLKNIYNTYIIMNCRLFPIHLYCPFLFLFAVVSIRDPKRFVVQYSAPKN